MTKNSQIYALGCCLVFVGSNLLNLVEITLDGESGYLDNDAVSGEQPHGENDNDDKIWIIEWSKKTVAS